MEIIHALACHRTSTGGTNTCRCVRIYLSSCSRARLCSSCSTGHHIPPWFLLGSGTPHQEWHLWWGRSAYPWRCVSVHTHSHGITHITGSLFPFQRHKIRYTPVQIEMMTRQACIWSDRWDHKSHRETSRMRGDSRWPSSTSPPPLPFWLTRLSVRQVLLREQKGAHTHDWKSIGLLEINQTHMTEFEC